MASIKQAITQNFMKGFLHDPFSKGDRIYTDTEATGLELRVTGKRATWVARYKQTSVTLGVAVPADPKKKGKRVITSSALVRKLNEHIRHLIDIGSAPDIIQFFLDYFYTDIDGNGAGNIRLAQDKTDEKLARDAGELKHETAWTLQDCLDAFARQRSGKDAAEPMKDTSIAIVESTIKAAFGDWLDKPVTKLTKKIAVKIRDKVDETRGASPGIKVVRNLSSLLSYSLEVNSDCGLDEADQWWVGMKVLRKIKERKTTLTTETLGKTLALVEYFLHNRMPSREGVQHGVRDNTYAAFVWLLLTCHRQSSGLSLEVQNYKPWAGHDGWYVGEWPSEIMKNGQSFSLPIPPRVVDVMEGIWQKCSHRTTSTWVFPSEKDSEKRVTRFGTLGVLKRLSGRDDIGMKLRHANEEAIEKGAKANSLTWPIDLLELNGIPHWSPHLVRNVVSTFLDLVGMPGGASAVLGHTLEKKSKDEMSPEQREAWSRQNVAAVTHRYHAVQHLKLKSEAMLMWSDAVLDAWEDARRKPLFVDVGKTVILDEPAAAERNASVATA